MTTTTFAQLSQDLTALAAAAGPSVLRLEGRRGPPAPAVAWSSDGTLVASSHLVDDDGPLEVGLPGGEVVRAELVGRDPASDLAVLRAAAAGLAVPRWGEPDGLGPGALVLALSRPGRSLRVDLGVLARAAGEWRAPSGAALPRYLEASLPLRPGFSGSLALAADGTALGLATAGLLRGTPLILPAAALARLVPQLLEHGGPRRGWLGVATVPVRLPRAAAVPAGQETALLVTGLEPDSPAERAGLLLGDAVLSLGGARTAGAADLLAALEPLPIGAPAPVRVLRAGEPRDLAVTVGERAALREGGR